MTKAVVVTEVLENVAVDAYGAPVPAPLGESRLRAGAMVALLAGLPVCSPPRTSALVPFVEGPDAAPLGSSSDAGAPPVGVTPPHATSILVYLLRSNSGSPVANRLYTLDVNGEVREGTTDADGLLREEHVEPGDWALTVDGVTTIVATLPAWSGPRIHVVGGWLTPAESALRATRLPPPRPPALFAPADVFGGRTCVRIGGFDPRASRPEDRGFSVCGIGPRLAAGYPCGQIRFRPRVDGGLDLEFVQSPVPADVYMKYGPSPGDRAFINPRCRETASLERDGDSLHMQGVPLYESEAECLSRAVAGPAFPVITRSAPDLTPPCWNMLLHDMTRYDADLRRLRGGKRE